MSAIPIKPSKRKQKGETLVYHKKPKIHGRSFSNVLRRGPKRHKLIDHHTKFFDPIHKALHQLVEQAKENKQTVYLWSTQDVLKPSFNAMVQKAAELLILQYSPNKWPWPAHTKDKTAEDPFNSI